jgi:hypothetical protein
MNLVPLIGLRVVTIGKCSRVALYRGQQFRVVVQPLLIPLRLSLA